MGSKVKRLALNFLNNDGSVEDINQTFIVPIPKVKNALNMSKSKPISLCNFLYKMIAKVLANRLKVVLPLIVDEAQSGFVPRWLITDNAIIAFESIY